MLTGNLSMVISDLEGSPKPKKVNIWGNNIIEDYSPVLLNDFYTFTS